jgi:hypothetical protein
VKALQHNGDSEVCVTIVLQRIQKSGTLVGVFGTGLFSLKYAAPSYGAGVSKYCRVKIIGGLILLACSFMAISSQFQSLL